MMLSFTFTEKDNRQAFFNEKYFIVNKNFRVVTSVLRWMVL